AHDGENGLRPPAVALYHALELRPSVCRHAQPIDNDVADLVGSVLRSQTPVDSDWPISTGPADDLAGDDRPIRIGPAGGHTGAAAILGVIRQFFTISEHDIILEQPEEFLLLPGSENPPKSGRAQSGRGRGRRSRRGTAGGNPPVSTPGRCCWSLPVAGR